MLDGVCLFPSVFVREKDRSEIKVKVVHLGQGLKLENFWSVLLEK